MAVGKGGKADAGRSEVVAVEEVEELGAELDDEALADLGVLEDGEVGIAESGTVELVAAQRTELTGGWEHEAVEVDPVGVRRLTLVAGAGGRDLADAIETFVGSGVVGVGEDLEGLSTVEVDETVGLPAAGEEGQMLRAGNLVAEVGGEVVAGVVVGVAVVSLEVGAVLREGSAVLRDLVEVVGPGVDGLGGEVVPVVDAKLRLERVVVGGSDAGELVDVAVLAVLREEGAGDLTVDVGGVDTGLGLVDIEQAEQVSRFGANVADLGDGVLVEGALDVEAVVLVVGGAEVGGDAEDAAGGVGGAGVADGGREDGDTLLDGGVGSTVGRCDRVDGVAPPGFPSTPLGAWLPGRLSRKGLRLGVSAYQPKAARTTVLSVSE